MAAVVSLVMSRDALIEWGTAVGRRLRAPVVLAISGELGSGKTTLAQAICRGYGVAGEVTSPTFAIAHLYEAARGPVWHLDLYRLPGPAELTNIGWDDIINSDALVLVEWPEHAGAYLPQDAVRIELGHVENPGQRSLVHAALPW